MKPPLLCLLYLLPIPQGNSTPLHPKGHRASSFVSFWGLPSTITLGSGHLLMEAVFCPGFLVLINGRMSREVGKQIQFRLLNSGNTCRLPQSLLGRQKWVLIFFPRQCNSFISRKYIFPSTWLWLCSTLHGHNNLGMMFKGYCLVWLPYHTHWKWCSQWKIDYFSCFLDKGQEITTYFPLGIYYLFYHLIDKKIVTHGEKLTHS